ncbi:MAG: TRAP transporter substrate-binding protein [Boseongicola sp.]
MLIEPLRERSTKLLLTAATVAGIAFAGAAAAKDLSLAYFMGPKHPMNKAVFTPFAEKLAEVSGGALTVQQFPGGALNSVPPKQYAILLDGVADIVFTLPGYTGDVFPMTNVVNLPGLCDDSVSCTAALQRAKGDIETEYNAKVLALWANSPPILLTKDKPVRTLEDLQGLKIRITSKGQVPFVKALGASPVGQPVTVINQNLANGVIDAISIDPSGIGSFKLHEVAKYLTTWFPGSGSAFVLLLNNDVYNAMSDEEKGWIDAASDASLADSGATGFKASTQRGLKIAREAGLEFIDISPDEKARWDDIVAATMEEVLAQPAGSKTVGDIFEIMKGE